MTKLIFTKSVILGCVLACLAGAVQAQNFGSLLGGLGGKKSGSTAGGAQPGPNVGDLVGALAPTATNANEEIAVGEGVAATVLGAAKPWANPEAQKYVNLIGRRIADHGERKELPWTFAIIDTSSINAFAAPGGIVLVTRGLYEILGSEDELAAILAHEIGHVQRQHHYKVIKQQKLVQFGASFVQKETGKDNAIAQKLVGMGTELIARGLDKDAEFEADRDAMVLAARAGYDSSSILAVLEKLHGKLASDNSVQLLFKTHPAPAERIQRLSAAVTPELELAAVTSPAANRISTPGR